MTNGGHHPKSGDTKENPQLSDGDQADATKARDVSAAAEATSDGSKTSPQAESRA